MMYQLRRGRLMCVALIRGNAAHEAVERLKLIQIKATLEFEIILPFLGQTAPSREQMGFANVVHFNTCEFYCLIIIELPLSQVLSQIAAMIIIVFEE